MPRLIRVVLPAVVVFSALVGVGCGKKNEGTPNPDLQIPDVPPGGHGSKSEMKDMGKKGK